MGSRSLLRGVVGIGVVALGTIVIVAGSRVAPQLLPRFHAGMSGLPTSIPLDLRASPTLEARRVADRHCVEVIGRADAVLKAKMPASVVDFSGAVRTTKAIGSAVHEYDVLDRDTACSPEVRAKLIDYVGALLRLSYELNGHPTEGDTARAGASDADATSRWIRTVRSARDAVIDARAALEARIAAP
jgi:hypothetical protein